MINGAKGGGAPRTRSHFVRLDDRRLETHTRAGFRGDASA